MHPGKTIIMDNATYHHSGLVQALSAHYRCRLLYLPPYSPDLNPLSIAGQRKAAFAQGVWRACHQDGARGICSIPILIHLVLAVLTIHAANDKKAHAAKSVSSGPANASTMP